MQQIHLDNKGKFKILTIITGILVVISVPLFLPHIEHGHGIHTLIHVSGIILGTFLSVVGAITYLEYKTPRLLLVFLAFLAITIGEILSATNMLFVFWPSYSSIDSMITHGLILMMLTFFSFGIFRRD
ncbi:conserved membrane protein of unknown function [Nitrosopumilus piranensis]|uniref:Uncharacterized protein n=2 Tax=Nitrosopumilus piranensis TaxID=1582439 RepID=A0A0C5BXC8_9ARCH|nr:conserved membrane protein of unknown function [Nitrosopumilus piranensis]